jgi:hypothetical protein
MTKVNGIKQNVLSRRDRYTVIRVDNRFLIAGDGIKIAKEAEKMPAVKKLHQESGNSDKPPYIYGHHHGVLEILAGW